MPGYLLDTNHVSAVFRQSPTILSRIAASPQSEYGVALPAIGELWFMVFNSVKIAQNTSDLERVLADFIAWPFDDEAAREFGRIKADQRRAGRPIPDVDVQIAAIARSRGLVLLTADAHFSHVNGLTIEDWTRP